MRKVDIENLLKGVKNEFYSNDFTNGDCLNLVVALHDHLKSKNIKSHVVPIMRNTSASNMTAFFDHAVLFVEIEGQSIENGFNSKYTFDVNGSDAYANWTESSPYYNERNMIFWINSPPKYLESFCVMSQESHGDTIMKKLLNNKNLRNSIFKYFQLIQTQSI
jgi:hypothetical protein